MVIDHVALICASVHTFIWLAFSARRLGDNEVFDKHIADLSGKLDVYNKILSKQKYLAGDVRPFYSLIT